MPAAGHPPGMLPPPSVAAGSRHGAGADPYGGTHPQAPAHYAYTQYAGAGHGLTGAPPPPPPEALRGSPAYGAAVPGPGPSASAVYVATPKIEMQPWARNVWRWLADNTTGVARVDLRRPTAPLPEQYDGNILFVHSRHSTATNAESRSRGWGARRKRDRVPAAHPPTYATPMYGQIYPEAPQPVVAAAQVSRPPLLTGARIKITRSFIIGGARRGGADDRTSSEVDAGAEAAAAAAAAAPPPPLPRQRRPRHELPSTTWAEMPLLDVGIGVNLDVDQQQIQPVARIKIKDLISIKAAPMGVLKISRSLPLGPVALKVRYELPLAHANRFWQPPARLMVRLDNAAGSGIHLTPGGIEFDEQVLRFGTAVSLRASAGLLFPRQLPLEDDEPPLRLQVHRLSLKSIW